MCAAREPGEPVRAEGVAWLVLGAPRLHALLRRGRMVSKTEAGRHVAEVLPWSRGLVERVLAWRRGEPVEFTAADGLAASDLVEALVADVAALRASGTRARRT